MARYKVVVQVYKEFSFEAASQEEAMKMADEEMKKLGITDKYNVNHAKNLDKKKSKSQEKREAVQAAEPTTQQ